MLTKEKNPHAFVYERSDKNFENVNLVSENFDMQSKIKEKKK